MQRRLIFLALIMFVVSGCCKQHSRGSLTPESIPTVAAAIAAFGSEYEIRAWENRDLSGFRRMRTALEAKIMPAEGIRIYKWQSSALGRRGRPCEEILVAADGSGRILDIYVIWHT